MWHWKKHTEEATLNPPTPISTVHCDCVGRESNCLDCFCFVFLSEDSAATKRCLLKITNSGDLWPHRLRSSLHPPSRRPPRLRSSRGSDGTNESREHSICTSSFWGGSRFETDGQTDGGSLDATMFNPDPGRRRGVSLRLFEQSWCLNRSPYRRALLSWQKKEAVTTNSALEARNPPPTTTTTTTRAGTAPPSGCSNTTHENKKKRNFLTQLLLLYLSLSLSLVFCLKMFHFGKTEIIHASRSRCAFLFLFSTLQK